MDDKSKVLNRTTFVTATVLYIAFAIVFTFGAVFMIMALVELVSPQPASSWSALCALIGLAFQLAGVGGLVMVTNSLEPYTGLRTLTVPKWKRAHAE